MTFVLASGSATRRALLEQAGLAFEVLPARVDERAVEAPLANAGRAPAEIAAALARAKALDVAGRAADRLVVGADQVLEIDGRIGHKPSDRAAAEAMLARLSGRDHRLHTAVAMVRGEAGVVWSHAETARLRMRELAPGDIARYLDRVGPEALASVGAYQIEGPGVQLFEEIEGDFFAILGLPLLPLLAALRRHGELP